MTAGGRSWFVRGGLVLDPVDGEARRRDLVVRDGTIEASVEPGPQSAAGAGLPVHDATDRLILPGLVNAHTHGHANLMKGVADRWPLEVSLTHGPWLTGARDVETIYLSTLLGAIEMIGSGTTACYDLVYEFPVPTIAGLTAVARAYADVGMRAVIAPMVADRTLFEAIPELAAALPATLAQRVDGFELAPVAQTVDVLRAFAGLAGTLPAGIDVALAPTIPHHCSDELLAACRDLAREANLKLHMHLAESRLQAEMGPLHYGTSLAAHVADLGLLGPHFTAAHGVWLDDADLDRFAAAGAGIVHVPASNFRLGSGLARVRAMLDRGIAVGLATDGANSSDALDMFLAMRLAAFASRTHAGAPSTWLSSAEVFRAATAGGATLLGLGDRIGRLAPGFAADLVFLDLAHPALVPLNDALNQVVNGDARAALTDVMIDGRLAVRDRTVPAWTAAVRERVADAARRLHRESLAARGLAEAIEPFVARFVAERARAPFPLERLVRA